MWIVSATLSACSPDMRGLDLDSERWFEVCASSLTSRGKSMPFKFWSREWRAGRLNPLRSARMFENSTVDGFLERWTESSVGFLARTSASPVEAKESVKGTGQDCGLSSHGSFARWDPDGCSWRTSELWLDGDWRLYLGTWPRWGSMRNGECSARQRPVRRTGETGFSFWPTSTATDAKASGWGETSDKLNTKRHSGTTLTDAAVRQNWSTIRASDGQHSGPNQKFGAGGVPLPAQAAQWRTPTTGMVNQETGTVEYAHRVINHPTHIKTLSAQTKVWLTPRASDGEGGVMEMREGEKGRYKLRDHAVNVMKQLPTPAVADTEGSRKTRSGKRSNEPLLNGMAAQWPTPLSQDGKNGTVSAKTLGRNSRPLRGVAVSVSVSDPCFPPGQQSWKPGDTFQKTSNPQLNPRFVEWLMGLPEGWVELKPLGSTSYASWATALCQQLRRLLG